MKNLLLGLGLTLSTIAAAQSNKDRGPMDFPELEFTEVKGAPKLSNPFMVMGEKRPVLTEKHGLIAPALYDWNKDGKRDLLVGEFETGDNPDDSNLRVYLNVGKDKKPKFTDDFVYAKDTKGTKFMVYQWCCIGFTPMLYDLNNDGNVDILTGQYHPGEVTWFRGTKEGKFLPGIKVEQEGDPASNGQMRGYDRATGKSIIDKTMTDENVKSFGYWNYSAASFGDFDGDGDLDLIAGGSAIRFSENIGTSENPRFAKRIPLKDTDGKYLRTRYLSKKRIDQFKSWGMEVPKSGTAKTQQFVVDWNGDGILDILSTDDYTTSQSFAVSYFEGVGIRNGQPVFKPGVDLIKAKDGSKALPGSGNRVYVDDWNKDGVLDLILGASIVTVRDKFHGEYSWTWEEKTGIESAGKDAGHPPGKDLEPEATFEEFKKNFIADMKERGFDNDIPDSQLKDRYESSKKWYYGKLKEQANPNTPDEKVYRHQGRVYVFLGKK